MTSAGVLYLWDGTAWRNASISGETPLVLTDSDSIDFTQSGASGHTATGVLKFGAGLKGPTPQTSHPAWFWACSPNNGARTGVNSSGQIVGTPPHYVVTSKDGVCTGPIAMGAFGVQATAVITNPSPCRNMLVQVWRHYIADINTVAGGSVQFQGVYTENGGPGTVDWSALAQSSPTAAIRNGRPGGGQMDAGHLVGPGQTFTFGVNSVATDVAGANTVNGLCHQVYLLGITEGFVGE